VSAVKSDLVNRNIERQLGGGHNSYYYKMSFSYD